MFAIPPNTRKNELIDLVINSRNRDDYSTTNSNNFTITLDTPIPGQITRYGLKTCVIPKTGYNIIGSFQITDSVSTKTVTLTSGNYTATSLITELETKLNDLLVDTYTVTLIGARLVIGSTFSSFIINPNNLTSDLLFNLGFGNSSSTATLGSLTAPNNINLSGPEYLYINIAPLKKHIKNSAGFTHNFVVNNGCSYGDVVYHNSQNTFIQEYPPFNLVSELNISKFTVSLRTEDGTLYDLNGSDWIMIINLEIVKNYSYQG